MMENFAKILTYLELTGLILGILGNLFTVVVYHMDITWKRYMPENELVLPFPRMRPYYTRINNGEHVEQHKDNLGYQYLHNNNIYQTHARISQFDGITCVMMAILVFGALGHVICSVLNAYFHERMERHKTINKIVTFGAVTCSLSLVYTLLCANDVYDSYIEKTFYAENQTRILVNFEPGIHWPCYLIKANETQPHVNHMTGPHMCQYKLYKIISVVLFLCYAMISISVIHLISREQMNRLVELVEDRLGPERRRIQSYIRRSQVAAAEAAPIVPRARRLQDSNATLVSGNITVHPSGFSSSPTLNGSDCVPMTNCDNDGQPPPPYPASNQDSNVNLTVMPLSITSTPISNIQVVDNTGNPVTHLTVTIPLHQEVLEEPPPSYSSTFVAVKNWRKP